MCKLLMACDRLGIDGRIAHCVQVSAACADAHDGSGMSSRTSRNINPTGVWDMGYMVGYDQRGSIEHRSRVRPACVWVEHGLSMGRA